jgi:trk system potassium uptake protein TrkH
MGADGAATSRTSRPGLGRRLRARLARVAQTAHPARVGIVAFAVAVLVVTALLMLPVAAEPGQTTTFRQALFTATSAVCVTGLAVVDTPTHWSAFGEIVILGGIQAGGFGIMTLASLLGLLASRRLGLRSRLLSGWETRAEGLGDVRRVLRGVARTTFVVEGLVALALSIRFWRAYDQQPGEALYSGVFHAVSAFNNAGFSIYSDNLMRFTSDPYVCLPIAVAVVLGGLGFPVLFELRRELTSPSTWSLHTKTTLLTYGLLLAGGTVAISAFEWGNPGTLGPLSLPAKVLAGFFQGGVQPRTAGFNSLDIAEMEPASLLVTDVLMFIGGGSAGTAGGIKVTTFMVLFFAILAEARGEPHVDAFGREVAAAVLRQALAVALLGVALVVTGTLVLLAVSGLPLDAVLYESTSAFATVGLSTGITADLPAMGQYVLVVLMFLGRTGPVTLATALVLHERRRLYRRPEERMLVG